MAGNGEESGVPSLNPIRTIFSDGSRTLENVGITQNHVNSSVDVARKYGCLRDILRQQVDEAKEALRCTDTPIVQLNDCRQDLRRLVEDMQRYAMAITEDSSYMTDFLSRRSEATTIVAHLAERLESQERARSLDRLKLTPVQTPKFGGLISDYLAFKAEFHDVIVNRASDRVALLKLKEEALRGGSLEYNVVAGCRTLREAFDELDAFFGNAEIQRNALLIQLRELPPVADVSDSHGLRVIYTTLEVVMKRLELIEGCELLDSAIFSALMLKIPDYIARKIDEKIAEKNVRGTQDRFHLFISACKRHATLTDLHHYRMKAYDYDFSNSDSGREVFKRHPSIHLTSMHRGASKATKSTCLFHENAKRHPTSACSRLFQLSDEDIFAKLKDNGHCLRCFNKHKAGKQCNVVCTHTDCPCSHTHGKLLHSIFTQQADPLSGVRRQLQSRDPDDMPDADTDQLHDSVGDSEDNRDEDCLHSDSDFTSYDSDSSVGSNVAALSVARVPCADLSAGSQKHSESVQAAIGRKSIRPCHEAFVQAANGELVTVNIFYDLGSDLSQITWDCAARAAFQPVATVPRLHLHVAGAREAAHLSESALFDVPFRNSSGSIIFTSTCTAVPYIGKLREASDNVVFRQFQNAGHNCSDAIPAVSGEIDCLIGVNCSEVHPRPIASIGSMTLAQTGFGKVVYGAHPDVSSELKLESAGCHFVGANTQEHAELGGSEVLNRISEKVDNQLDDNARLVEFPVAASRLTQPRSLVKITAKDDWSPEYFEIQYESKAKRSGKPWEIDRTVDSEQQATGSLDGLARLQLFIKTPMCSASLKIPINLFLSNCSLLRKSFLFEVPPVMISTMEVSNFRVCVAGAEWLQEVLEILWDPGGA